MKEEGYVGVHTQDHIATIEFFHPHSNSLPGHLLRALAEEILSAGRHPQIKVILLKSAGERAFCAGASFTELSAISNLHEGEAFFSGFAGVINAIRTCGKIVIANIQGKAVGGGVGIAAAADIVIATAHASVRLSELAVGIGPFVIGPAVERKIGKSAFAWMSLTPDEWQTAEWALAKGLYHQLADNQEELQEKTNSLCKRLCSYNPEALVELKTIFWQGTENWDSLLKERAAISGRLVLSDFSKNAINALKPS
jgi:methylglutaconyl-CoA hydratase